MRRKRVPAIDAQCAWLKRSGIINVGKIIKANFEILRLIGKNINLTEKLFFLAFHDKIFKAFLIVLIF
jgi:hypothetical protein